MTGSGAIGMTSYACQDPRSVVPCCLNCVKSRDLHSESERLNIEEKNNKKIQQTPPDPAVGLASPD